MRNSRERWNYAMALRLVVGWLDDVVVCVIMLTNENGNGSRSAAPSIEAVG
jgi:hypothetical protein